MILASAPLSATTGSVMRLTQYERNEIYEGRRHCLGLVRFIRFFRRLRLRLLARPHRIPPLRRTPAGVEFRKACRQACFQQNGQCPRDVRRGAIAFEQVVDLSSRQVILRLTQCPQNGVGHWIA